MVRNVSYSWRYLKISKILYLAWKVLVNAWNEYPLADCCHVGMWVPHTQIWFSPTQAKNLSLRAFSWFLILLATHAVMHSHTLWGPATGSLWHLQIITWVLRNNWSQMRKKFLGTVMGRDLRKLGFKLGWNGEVSWRWRMSRVSKISVGNVNSRFGR